MRTLQRWNPIQDAINMSRTMDQLFNNVSLDTSRPLATPAMDVVEHEDRAEVVLNLPGVKPEDVNIEFHEGVLSISTEFNREENREADNYTYRERYHGSYRRSLRVPKNLDVNSTEARFDNGVLTLSIPKSPEARPLRIPVNNNAQQLEG